MSKRDRRTKVLLADDHSIVRQGLHVMLEQSGEFEVVGHAKDGEEAVKAAAELSPDVIVMDVLMPGMDGVDACREIIETRSDTRVIMLTSSTEEDAVVEAVAAGATAYLQKVTGMDRLLNTVRVVASDEMPLPTEVVRRVFAGIRSGAGLGNEPDALTKREREILISFCRGKPYKTIAADRGVKPVTIRNAVYNIQVKLGVESKQEIVVWAVRSGLLDD